MDLFVAVFFGVTVGFVSASLIALWVWDRYGRE